MIAGVAGRYATALFELAKDGNQIEPIGGELTGFLSTLDAHKDLDEALMSPAHSLGAKTSILKQVLSKTGVKGLTGNFLALVAQNNRLSSVRDMTKAFNLLVDAHKGEARAQVISAHKLSDQHIEALAKTLKSTVGQDVKIDASVDPELLGGLIVKLGSKMIDSSLRSKLNNLRVALNDAS